MKQKIKMHVLDWKILFLIKELNDRGFYANAKGISKILVGEFDYETRAFEGLKTYSVYASISSRKVKASLRKLVEYNLIKNAIDLLTGKHYFMVTLSGENELKLAEEKKPFTFKKVEKLKEENITRISENSATTLN